MATGKFLLYMEHLGMLKSPGPKLWLPVTGRSRRSTWISTGWIRFHFCIWALGLLGLGMGQNDQPQNEMIYYRYYRTQKRIKMQK